MGKLLSIAMVIGDLQILSKIIKWMTHFLTNWCIIYM
jgi:hypothetical protein